MHDRVQSQANLRSPCGIRRTQHSPAEHGYRCLISPLSLDARLLEFFTVFWAHSVWPEIRLFGRCSVTRGVAGSGIDAGINRLTEFRHSRYWSMPCRNGWHGNTRPTGKGSNRLKPDARLALVLSGFSQWECCWHVRFNPSGLVPKATFKRFYLARLLRWYGRMLWSLLSF